MPTFGPTSEARLATCHEHLQRVCRDVIRYLDFTVLCGRRTEEEQEDAFHNGRSSLHWPESKHNAIAPGLSEAVDIAPWHLTKPHIRWENEREFIMLAGRIVQSASAFGIRLRWGGDWDQDDDLYDKNEPWDLVHFELSDPAVGSGQ